MLIELFHRKTGCVSVLVTCPGDDGWLKKNFSICYSVGSVSVSPVDHWNQVTKGCPLGAATKTWVPGMSTNSFLGYTRREAEGEVEDGSNQPL